MTWNDIKLSRSMRVLPPSQLPSTPVGRMEFIHRMLNYPVFDEEGNDTGETAPIISVELAKKLMDAPPANAPRPDLPKPLDTPDKP